MPVRFSLRGEILDVSPDFLKMLGLDEAKRDQLQEMLPGNFHTDIFQSPIGIHNNDSFNNYRLWIEVFSREKRLLFNVSGYKEKNDVVVTLWHPVIIERMKDHPLSEGSIINQLKIQNLIRPYIPPQVIRKANDMVQIGRDELPDEVRESTILFADLVGFTQKVEEMNPHAVIDLLNLALGVAAKVIEGHGGTIDKFMGDAVLAFFQNPLAAVSAATEIQIQFFQFNKFREIAGEDSLEFRIGIHTGRVIFGSVGTPQRMDYTPLGDTVNTASRIEKHSLPGSVLISEKTYDRVKDSVEVTGAKRIQVKGKVKELSVMFVRKVRWVQNEKVITLDMENPEAMDVAD